MEVERVSTPDQTKTVEGWGRRLILDSGLAPMGYIYKEQGEEGYQLRYAFMVASAPDDKEVYQLWSKAFHETILIAPWTVGKPYFEQYADKNACVLVIPIKKA
jgi:hypothetical protein